MDVLIEFLVFLFFFWVLKLEFCVSFFYLDNCNKIKIKDFLKCRIFFWGEGFYCNINLFYKRIIIKLVNMVMVRILM